MKEIGDVMPKKPIKPITLRLEEGKSILLGGLAEISLVRGKPFFFTFFLFLTFFVFFFMMSVARNAIIFVCESYCSAKMSPVANGS